MGINLAHLKYSVVQPALTAIDLMSSTALNLVTGTACVESGRVYLKQVGGGPALSLWQIEPDTEADIWATYLDYQPALALAVRSLLCPGPTTRQLVGNLPYGAAICRIKYRRAPQVLPAYNDAAGLANYWKTIYNSSLGAGVVDAAHVALFQSAINA
jgi:hypothetical protein